MLLGDRTWREQAEEELDDRRSALGQLAVARCVGLLHTKVLNTYKTSDQQEELQVRYERSTSASEHSAADYTDLDLPSISFLKNAA